MAPTRLDPPSLRVFACSPKRKPRDPFVTASTCASGSCPNLVISGTGASVCFFTEIDGDLAHGGSARIHKGFGPVWFLDLISPSNNNLRVVTACINLRSGTSPTLVNWSSQSQAEPVYHGTASSRCFLSEVTANNTSAFLGFDTSFFIANQQPGPYDYGVLGVFPSGSDVSIGMECFSTPSVLAGLAYGNGTPNKAFWHAGDRRHRAERRVRTHRARRHVLDREHHRRGPDLSVRDDLGLGSECLEGHLGPVRAIAGRRDAGHPLPSGPTLPSSLRP